MSELNDIPENERSVFGEPQKEGATDGDVGRSEESAAKSGYFGQIDDNEQDVDGITINNPKYILIGEEESFKIIFNSKKLFDDFEKKSEPLEGDSRPISSNLRGNPPKPKPLSGNDVESRVSPDEHHRDLITIKDGSQFNNVFSAGSEAPSCFTGDGCWRVCECRKSMLTIIGCLKKQDSLIINLYDYFASKKAKRVIFSALMALLFVVVFFLVAPSLNGLLPDFIRDPIGEISGVVIGACVAAVISLLGFSYAKFESIKNLIIKRMINSKDNYNIDKNREDLDEALKRLGGG